MSSNLPISFSLFMVSLSHPDGCRLDAGWLWTSTNATEFERSSDFKKDGKWIAGPRGAAIFSYGWQKVIEIWPEEKGYNPFFVLVGGSPYYTVPENEDFYLTNVLYFGAPGPIS